MIADLPLHWYFQAGIPPVPYFKNAQQAYIFPRYRYKCSPDAQENLRPAPISFLYSVRTHAQSSVETVKIYTTAMQSVRWTSQTGYHLHCAKLPGTVGYIRCRFVSGCSSGGGPPDISDTTLLCGWLRGAAIT